MYVVSVSFVVMRALQGAVSTANTLLFTPNDSLVWIMVKVKVKCTLVQALRLCTGRTAHRGSRGIAILFNDQRH
jgi:hypothetical protein